VKNGCGNGKLKNLDEERSDEKMNFLNVFQSGIKSFWQFIILFGMYSSSVWASTTGGDLARVAQHVQSEVTGDVITILGWVSFALGCIAAVAKMNLGVVMTMFGIFLMLILGPDVIQSHFSALI
jgi:hypothetical protein